MMNNDVGSAAARVAAAVCDRLGKSASDRVDFGKPLAVHFKSDGQYRDMVLTGARKTPGGAFELELNDPDGGGRVSVPLSGSWKDSFPADELPQILDAVEKATDPLRSIYELDPLQETALDAVKSSIKIARRVGVRFVCDGEGRLSAFNGSGVAFASSVAVGESPDSSRLPKVTDDEPEAKVDVVTDAFGSFSVKMK